MFDGYDSCSEDTSSSSSSEESEEEVAPLPSNLPIIKNNGQVYTYPDGKSGMATCEMCGMVGVRDAFYSKTKRFCSVSCSRSYSSNSKKASILARLQGKPPTKKAKVLQKQPLVAKLAAYAQYQATLQNQAKTKAAVSMEGFSWGNYINSNSFIAAPVTCFKHAPMGTCWGDISENVRVEVPNTDCSLPTKVFWIAGIVKLAGYNALLRYEGFENDSGLDFWCNICGSDIHPVGWCAASGKPLVPPRTIQHKYTNWKAFLVKRLTGAKTLPPDFSQKVSESMQYPFKPCMRVEVVDKRHLCRTRVAVVESVIGGRLRLVYEESEDRTDDFWCHMHSPLIHHIGWSRSIGHRFKRSDITKKQDGHFDTPPHLFAKVKEVDQSGEWFKEGMKLEAIDPLNLSTICVATIRKVSESMQYPFKPCMRVEVVDKRHLCRTRVAVVESVIGGRLRLVYEESEDRTDDFWCHMHSPLIHHIGWSRSIGHRFKRSGKHLSQELLSKASLRLNYTSWLFFSAELHRSKIAF